MAKRADSSRHPVNIRLPRRLAAQLWGIAKASDVSVTSIIEDALRKWIEALEADGVQVPVDQQVLRGPSKKREDDDRTPAERVRAALKRRRKQ